MRPTPKVIQALPMPSVERQPRWRVTIEAHWGTFVVVLLLLIIALLNGLVPRIAEILAGWL